MLLFFYRSIYYKGTFYFAKLLSDKKKKLYLAIELLYGDPTGNRTRDTTVKGWCLDRLTIGPCKA